MSGIENRKKEHVEIVTKDDSMDRQKSYFDNIHLTHRALPEINLSDVDVTTKFCGKQLNYPLLISSMTGGSSEAIREINKNLAIAAEAENVALAVGSQRVMLTDSSAHTSFDLRAFAPNTLLFANIGAIQLNYRVSVEHVQKMIDVLEADALILHLNPLQEAVQPEGDIDFSNLSKKIEELVKKLDVPVIVKEVGAGISKADAKILVKTGVKTIDVAGAGGTSWSRIESARAADSSLGECFQDWGIPTPQALDDLSDLDVSLIASGGIRTGVDMAKAVILGASLCGIARPLLVSAMESSDAVCAAIERIKKEFTTAMFLLGVQKIDDLRGHKELIESYENRY